MNKAYFLLVSLVYIYCCPFSEAQRERCNDRFQPTMESLTTTKHFNQSWIRLNLAGEKLRDSCDVKSETVEQILSVCAINTQTEPTLWFVTDVANGPALGQTLEGAYKFKSSVILNATVYADEQSVILLGGTFMDFVKNDLVSVLKERNFTQVEWANILDFKITGNTGQPKTAPTKASPTPSNATVPTASCCTPSETSAVCFPGEAIVQLQNGSRIMMKEVQVGDHVQVGVDKYDAVLMMTHADANMDSDMVIISTQHARIAASSGHLIYANGVTIFTKNTREGDMIPVLVGEDLMNETVLSVETKCMKGLFNPQTESGNILVGYEKASLVLGTAYTSTVPLSVAHSLLSPVRTVQILFELVKKNVCLG